MDNILTGAVATSLNTAGTDLIDLSVDVLYSTFQFMLNLVITNSALVVAAVVIFLLWRYVSKHRRKIM